MLALSKRSRKGVIFNVTFICTIAVFILSVLGTPVHGLDRVTYRMSWYWIGSFLPIFLAKERGYYKESGIDVEILEGRGSLMACELVGNKSNDFGRVSASSAFMAMSKGMPIKSTGVIRQDEWQGIIFLKGTNIKTPKDLEGKTMAYTADGSPEKLFPFLAAKWNLDEKKITRVVMDAASKPVALMQRRVDFMLGSMVDQLSIIKSKGYEPHYILFSDVGVVYLGATIIAHLDTIANKPDLVRRFIGASIKGELEALKESPEVVVDIFMKNNPSRDRRVFLDQLKDYYELAKLKTQTCYGYGDPNVSFLLTFIFHSGNYVSVPPITGLDIIRQAFG